MSALFLVVMVMSTGVMMLFCVVFVSKEMDTFFQIPDGVGQDEQSDADGHKRIDQSKIGESHDDGANQHNAPSQHIFQHMQADSPLVQGITAMGEISGAEIDTAPHNGKQKHTVIVDLNGMHDPADSASDDQNRTEKQDGRHEDAAEDGISFITVSAFSFQKVCDADACGVANIVYGVGKDGDASCQDAADTFKDGKCQIQYKSNKDMFF